MFLRRVKRIRVSITAGDTLIDLHKFDGNEADVWLTAAGAMQLGSSAGSHYKLSKRSYNIPNDLYEPKREGYTSTEIVLAFPLKCDGPVANPTNFVFAFLPVRRCGLRFSIPSAPSRLLCVSTLICASG